MKHIHIILNGKGAANPEVRAAIAIPYFPLIYPSFLGIRGWAAARTLPGDLRPRDHSTRRASTIDERLGGERHERKITECFDVDRMAGGGHGGHRMGPDTR